VPSLRGPHLVLSSVLALTLGMGPRAAAEEPPQLPPPEPPPSRALPPPAAEPLPPPIPLAPPSAPPEVVSPVPVAPTPPATAASAPDEHYPWDPDTPVPSGYVLRSRPDTGLIFGGSAMVSIGWVTSIAVGLLAAQSETERGIDGDGVEAKDWTPLYVPLGGPFVAVASVDSGGVGTALLVADGVLQLAGVGLILMGSLDQSHRAVRVAPVSGSLTIAPTVSAAGRGLVLEGAF
jgi:hypothetical protein